jgi:hypothetical protein
VYAQDLSFAPVQNYLTDGTPYGVEGADLNGDGAPDLLAASFEGDNIAVFLNDGSGSFSGGGSFAVTNAIRAVVAGDFDGDGNIDAVAASSIATIFFLAGAGDGSLGTPVASTDPVYTGRTFGLVSADFDGDGSLDVATLSDQYLTVFSGNGDGTFARTVVVETGTSTVQKTGLDVGDFDRDGWVDIVAANGDNQAIVAFNDGSGGFSFTSTYDLSSSAAYDADVADFNSDGWPDFAVAGGSQSAISVLLNDGSGGFGLPITLSGAIPMWSIDAADLDGDGLDDLLAAAGTSNVLAFLNNGDNSFSSSITISFGHDTTFDVETSDLDGDGLVDVFATNANIFTGFVGVRLNTTVPPAPGSDLIETKVPSPTPAPDENFGWSVHEGGGVLAVGAPDPGANAATPGQVDVFTQQSGSWVLAYTLAPSDGAVGDDFGSAVAVVGDLILVGARDHAAAGTKEGALYVFRHEGSSATELAKVLPPDPGAGDAFGREIDVDIANGRIIVGAHFWDAAFTDGAGAAYVFRVDGESLVLEATLTEPVAELDYYATAVAISGDYALVGAYRINGQQGRVWVYRRDGGGTWSLHEQLTASDASDLSRFGVAVDIDGTQAVVGAHINGTDFPGAAYTFELSAGSWIETQKLTAPDAEAGEYFGNPVAISSGRVLVSALRESGDGISRGGAVYVFEQSNATWSVTQKVVPSDRRTSDEFGLGLHVQPSRFFGGARNHNGPTVADAGAVYEFAFAVPVPGELTIWPGDTDGSGDVSETDLFPVANCFGLTGLPRGGDFDASWRPILVPAWGRTGATSACSPSSTLDPVLADATGDGVVDHKDVLPVGINFGLTPADTASSSGGPPLPRKTSTYDQHLIVRLAPDVGSGSVLGLSVRLTLPEEAEPVEVVPGPALAGETIRFWSFDPSPRVLYAAASLLGSQTTADPGETFLKVRLQSPQPVAVDDVVVSKAMLNTVDGPVTVESSSVEITLAGGVNTSTESVIPDRLELSVSPNPAGPKATIGLKLPTDGAASVTLYDAIGRQIRVLSSGHLIAGRYRFSLDTYGLASGVYFVRVAIEGDFSLARSLVITR